MDEWFEESIRQSFMRWLEDKGWSYDDDLLTAYRAGYEQRGTED